MAWLMLLAARVCAGTTLLRWPAQSLLGTLSSPWLLEDCLHACHYA